MKYWPVKRLCTDANLILSVDSKRFAFRCSPLDTRKEEWIKYRDTYSSFVSVWSMEVPATCATCWTDHTINRSYDLWNASRTVVFTSLKILNFGALTALIFWCKWHHHKLYKHQYPREKRTKHLTSTSEEHADLLRFQMFVDIYLTDIKYSRMSRVCWFPHSASR